MIMKLIGGGAVIYDYWHRHHNRMHFRYVLRLLRSGYIA